MNDAANPLESSLLREGVFEGSEQTWEHQTHRASLTGLLPRSRSFDTGSLVPVMQGRERGSSLVTFVHPGSARRESIVAGERGARACSITECGCDLARGEWTISRRCRAAYTALVLSVSLVSSLIGAAFAFGISISWCGAYIDPPRCADCENLNLWLAGEGFGMIAISAVGCAVAFTSAGAQLAVQAACTPGRRVASDDARDSTSTGEARGDVRTPYAPPRVRTPEEGRTSPNPFDRVRTPDAPREPTTPVTKEANVAEEKLRHGSCLSAIAPKCNCAGLALFAVYTLAATGWWIWGAVLFWGARPLPAASEEDQLRCASIRRIGRCVACRALPY